MYEAIFSINASTTKCSTYEKTAFICVLIDSISGALIPHTICVERNKNVDCTMFHITINATSSFSLMVSFSNEKEFKLFLGAEPGEKNKRTETEPLLRTLTVSTIMYGV